MQVNDIAPATSDKHNRGKKNEIAFYLYLQITPPDIFFKCSKSYLYAMDENKKEILKAVESYVTDMLDDQLSKDIQFHTLDHTRSVVDNCRTIADAEKIGEDDRFALLLAAWFHDTGYTSGETEHHEQKSIEIARQFLSAKNVPEETLQKMTGCINATQMPQNPQNELEKIICDADLFHLGADNFKESSKRLRKELGDFNKQDFSKKEWRQNNIDFLKGHTFFTPFGKEMLQPVQDEHLRSLMEKNNDKGEKDKKHGDKKEKDVAVKEMLQPVHDEHLLPLMEKNEDNGEKDKKHKDKKEKDTADAKAKKEKPWQEDRSVSTVFKIMVQSQNKMNQLADRKATTLISVNSIIISFVLANLLAKVQEDTQLMIPAIMFMLVCLTAIIFAILATRPNVKYTTFSPEDVVNKKPNLLFFGNFYHMTLPDYDTAMHSMLSDKSYLNSSIVKDAYFMGKVLARKYRLLTWSYNIFMYGLILTVLTFIFFLVSSGQNVEVYLKK